MIVLISLCAGLPGCEKKSGRHAGTPSGSIMETTNGHAPSANDGMESGAPKRSKSSERPASRPGTSETLVLMNRTSVPLIELPDQNVVERVEILNGMLERSGISPEKFRIMIDDRVLKLWEGEGSAGGFSLGVLELRDATLVDLMKHLCGSTRLRYRIGRGEAVVTLSQFLPPRRLEIPEGADPFAEFRQEEEPRLSPAEGDPFSPP
jgi:hypothetical protein